MNSHLRVTLVQLDIAWQDPEENRRRLATHFRGLGRHTDLIVLPEMFSTGFSMDADALAEPMDGPTVGWMREEAAAMGCAITGSLAAPTALNARTIRAPGSSSADASPAPFSRAHVAISDRQRRRRRARAE